MIKESEKRIDRRHSKSTSEPWSQTIRFDCMHAHLTEFSSKSCSTEELKNYAARELILRILEDPVKLEAHNVSFQPKDLGFEFFKLEKARQLPWENSLNVYFTTVAGFFSLCLTESKNVEYLCIFLKAYRERTDAVLFLSLRNHSEMKSTLISVIMSQIHALVVSGKTHISSSNIFFDQSNYHYSAFFATENIHVFEKTDGGEYDAVSREQNVFKISKYVKKKIQVEINTSDSLRLGRQEAVKLMYLFHKNKSLPVEFTSFKFRRLERTQDAKKDWYVAAIEVPTSSEAMKIMSSAEENESHFSLIIPLIWSGYSKPIEMVFQLVFRTNVEKEIFSFFRSTSPRRHHVMICKTDMSLISNESAFLSYELFDDKFNLLQSITKFTDGARCQPSDLQLEPSAGRSDLEDSICAPGSYSHLENFSNFVTQEWTKLIEEWKATSSRPTGFSQLAKFGILASERVNIWLLLCDVYDDAPQLRKNYHDALEEEGRFGEIISLDVHRIQAQQEFFKRLDGSDHNALARVCMAYANYDKEVGYFQCLAYIISGLLLNMDEETAFVLFVQIMYKFEFRDLILDSFRELHSLTYVLTRLLMNEVPEFAKFSSDISLDPSLFAPHWLITLFTAKFPPGVVDLALDVFFMHGKKGMVLLAVSIIKLCHRHVVALDFDKALEFISCSIPKMFARNESIHELMVTFNEFPLSDIDFQELLLEFERYLKHHSSQSSESQKGKSVNSISVEYQLKLEAKNAVLKRDISVKDGQLLEKIQKVTEKMREYETNIQRLERLVVLQVQKIASLKEREAKLKDSIRERDLKNDGDARARQAQIMALRLTLRENEMNEIRLKDAICNVIKQFDSTAKCCEKCTKNFPDLKLKHDFNTNIYGMVLLGKSYHKNSTEIEFENTINEHEMAIANIKNAIYNNM